MLRAVAIDDEVFHGSLYLCVAKLEELDSFCRRFYVFDLWPFDVELFEIYDALLYDFGFYLVVLDIVADGEFEKVEVKLAVRHLDTCSEHLTLSLVLR